MGLLKGASVSQVLEMSQLERDALLVRAVVACSRETTGWSKPRYRFDPVLLAWLGFKSQAEGEARMRWLNIDAPGDYRHRIGRRVLELDFAEAERCLARGF